MAQPTELHMLVKEALGAGFSMKQVGDKLDCNKQTILHWSQDERAQSRSGDAAKISTLKRMLGRNG